MKQANKNTQLIQSIKTIKMSLLDEGFIIDGIFGSYARCDNTKDSDVDILYHLDSKFYDKYSGFFGFKKLDEIKKLISKSLAKNIDLAPSTNLSQSAKKHILRDIIYV